MSVKDTHTSTVKSANFKWKLFLMDFLTEKKNIFPSLKALLVNNLDLQKIISRGKTD